MKKSIIAIAVSSAALASVSVHAADEGSTLKINGNLQYYYSDKDAGSQFEDGGSSLSLKGETVVSDDLTAFFNVKYKIAADEKKSESVNLDNAFVGFKGGFGTLKIGTFDSIYNDAIQDPIDQFEQLGMDSAPLTTEGDTIAYFSPTVSGFQVQLSTQIKGDADTGETTEINGVDFDIKDGVATTAVVKYSDDALTVAVGYDGLNNIDADSSTYGLSVGYNLLSNLNVTAKYETTDDLEDIVGLSTRYGYGYGDLYASVQSISPDEGDDYSQYAAGITYYVASNVYVFGEVGSYESSGNGDTDTQTAVGLFYGF